ncbi:MAG: hypothetical protein KIG74_07650 [Clostridiaceae bacterium]|nr:hypothetical protein [Clostridiaceae bacterium]
MQQKRVPSEPGRVKARRRGSTANHSRAARRTMPRRAPDAVGRDGFPAVTGKAHGSACNKVV